MKCYKCGKKTETLSELSEYGRNRLNLKPTRKHLEGYCEDCFTELYPELHTRTENEKSN